MTIPVYAFTSGILKSCGVQHDSLFENDPSEKVQNRKQCTVLSMVAFDILASITALIVGILGAVSVIGMPAAASYALIGISCAITFLWVAGLIAFCMVKNSQSIN